MKRMAGVCTALALTALCIGVVAPASADEIAPALFSGTTAQENPAMGTPPPSFGGGDAQMAVCGPDPVFWDNNLRTNGVNGRAVSPPGFPNIRVADDFSTAGNLAITGFHASIIEDATWTRGTLMETSIRTNNPAGGPNPGAGGILVTRTSAFTATATGASYFGRAEFRHCQVFNPALNVSNGRFWIHTRHPGGAGTGTGYWMTSDGGPDGSTTSTGYFSLDGGTTFTAEGDGWHHAFELNGTEVIPSGACCDDDTGVCTDNVPPENCQGRHAPGVTCANLDPPCGEFNDECENAADIACGDSVTFDNSPYTRGANDPPVCDPGGGGQFLEHTAWYKVRATTGKLVVSTCDSQSGNTVIALYHDDGGDCRQLFFFDDCDHNFCDPHARICADVTAGEDYYILVGSTPGTGSALVTLEVQCVEDCPEDPTAACCLDNGQQCLDLTERDCLANGGEWLEGEVCADDPCVAAGQCRTGETLLTQSNNNTTITAGNSVACSPDGGNTTTENSFARCFPLVLGQDIEVQSVEFGVEAVNVGPQTIKIRLLRDTNGCPPNTGNAVLIAERPVNLVVGFTGLIRVDFSGTIVTDGTSLIVDIEAPDSRGVSGFWPGSNALGQTGPTYLKSASCGIADWTNINDIGFPNMMLIQSICYTAVGEPDRGACCLVDGDCVEDQTPAECDGLGGEWQGADVTCEQADCQEHTGACCRDGDCTEETRTDCEQGGGCTRNPDWQCDGDVDGNGAVNPVDQGLVQANFGSQDPDDLCQYDIDCNGVINPVDSGLVQALFGLCNPPRPPCGGGPAGEFLGYDTTCEDNPCALGACCENDVCTGTTRQDECAGRWFEGEDCDQGFQCPAGACPWDNNIVTNGVNGRALSPPSFPLIRVADDFDFDAGCVVSELDADIIEDATWTPGAQVTVTVRRDQSGAPAPGAGGILAEQTVGTFTRTATGANYFGRADFLYSVTGLNIPIPNTAKHWIELRNPQGGGSGTNYWMTSDGGPDGMSSSTGYFSLDGGAVYTAEGAGWHHAFEINP